MPAVVEGRLCGMAKQEGGEAESSSGAADPADDGAVRADDDGYGVLVQGELAAAGGGDADANVAPTGARDAAESAQALQEALEDEATDGLEVKPYGRDVLRQMADEQLSAIDGFENF